MTPTFEVSIPRTKEVLATYSMDLFPDALHARGDFISSEENSDCSRFLFKIGTTTVSELSDLAKKYNLIVNNKNSGFTAIEPVPYFWNEAPGAHIRWDAYITEQETAEGKTPVLCLNCEAVLDRRHVASKQAINGWTSRTKRINGTLTVFYKYSN